jgi:hypothetical protein
MPKIIGILSSAFFLYRKPDMKMKAVFLLCMMIPGLAWNQLILNSDLSFDYSVRPGETVRGQIPFQNAGTDSIIVDIYQTDYLFNADGKHFYDEPGPFERSNAGWIDFSPKQVMLTASQKSVLNYEIHVPDVPALNGTYWSMLMIEETLPAQAERQGQVQIRFKNRYGVQIATTLEQDDMTTVKIAIENPNLDVYEDKRKFRVDIENQGNVLIKPNVWLEVFDADGNSIEVIHATAERLYPETSRRFNFELQQLKPGTYKGILVVDCGGDDLFGANYTFQLEK